MSNAFSAPKKALGQNFLQDANIIRKIVDALHVQPDDVVLEIGPGRGALTELLLQQAGHLHLVEFDRELSRYWQQRATEEPNLTVHAQDILKFDLNEVLDAAAGPVKVVGNLPYNISSPVLFHLTQYAGRIATQLVMLQKEVVDRLVAPPGNKQYGRLSVMLQYRYHIEKLFNVPPAAFFPPPKVESAIAQLTPLAEPDPQVVSEQKLEHLVKQAFAQRRKTLRNTLKGLLNPEQIESLGIDPGARAETLKVADFVALANLSTGCDR